MAVRTTESRIPGGFAAAENLGEVATSADSHYVLVSQLTSPLRMEKEALALRNTYVVFADTDKVIEPSSYQWQFEFFTADDPAQPAHTEVRSTIEGVAHIDTGEIAELINLTLTRVITTIDIDGVASPLVLDQRVIELFGDIESLFDASDKHIAKGGNPYVSRLIGNYYREYLLQSPYTEQNSNDTGPPLNLTATVLYLYQLLTPAQIIYEELRLWEDYINSELGESDVPRLPIGVCQVKPFLASMFVNEKGGPTKSTDLVPWDEETTGYDKYEQLLMANFHSLGLEQKTDFVNLLRFPKSAVKLSALLLDQMRKRHAPWLGMDHQQLLQSRDAVETIVSEYGSGPFNSTTHLTSVGSHAYDQLFTPYVQTLIATSYIQYEIIKIQVLDVRSGAPIKNARVKKLVIRSGNEEIGAKQDFAHDSEPTNVDQSIGRQSQFALLYLGYDPAGPSTNYGDTGRERYKEYWDDRILDGSVDAVTSGNPPEFMLNLIVAEYNSHRATNNDGILNIRIPSILFDNRPVTLDIGFWEFPIAKEAVSGDNTSVRRYENEHGTPLGGPTGLSIKWIAAQNTDWDINISDAGHFGWQVSEHARSTNLKIATRLVFKDNSLAFSGIDRALLSRYHGSTGHHFVLFGLQWCQPVWDEFTDSFGATAGAITEDTYVQIPHLKNMRMHLVTTWFDGNGSADYGGKGYGKVENSNSPKWRGDDGHLGIDLHAKTGDFVFSVHGGVVDNRTNYGKGGNAIILDWSGPGHTIIEYLHLSSFELAGMSRVLAGTLIGKAGRTGNLEPVSVWPGHVHLNIGAGGGDPIDPNRVRLRDTPDEYNKVAIPFNDMPLLFPCKCLVTKNSPVDCRFQDATFVNECWAPAELRCPYMTGGNANFKLQTQLRYLNENVNGNAYFHPGIIDGDLGDAPGNVEVDLASGTPVGKLEGAGNTRLDGKLIKIRQDDKAGWVEASLVSASNQISVPGGHVLQALSDNPVGATRMAIYLFKKQNGLLDFVDYSANFSMGDAFDELNNLAPVVIPF